MSRPQIPGESLDLWQLPMLFRVCPIIMRLFFAGNGGEIQWCFSQVKGTVEEDVTEGLCGYCPISRVDVIRNRIRGARDESRVAARVPVLRILSSWIVT